MADHFESKARDWDADDMVRQLSSGTGSAILKNIALNDQMRVLDFGAGTGLISSQVAPRVKRIIALDTSSTMLEQLLAKPELHGKVEAVCQNILENPLGIQFDLVMSAMAMHHVENTDKLVQRFAEHLKPGGMIALADLDLEDGSFHPENTDGVFHSGFERSALQALLDKHGFRNIRFTTALTLQKENRHYPVFLVTAEHP